MNPYERFFRLLWIVLGMVVREEVTIQWVNDCLETMHSNPKVSKAEIGFPPKPRKSVRKGQMRMTRSFKLEPVDWNNLNQFCETCHGNSYQRQYQSLVEYYQKNDNKPTSYRDLQRLGLAGKSISSLLYLFTFRMRDAGFRNYAFRSTTYGGMALDRLLCFAIVE
jgi:hypothetical protein